jgi:tRNA-2-methylthio-N6-dimethylallyladenosine synthase
MSHTETAPKIIDDSRQGEVFHSSENKPVDLLNVKRFYIESYGCQMNFSDSEIVASILTSCGYTSTHEVENADLILLNTCSIREKAEETVRKRLRTIDKIKLSRPGSMVGILGCMAERLKKSLLEEEKLVDLVVVRMPIAIYPIYCNK